MSRHGLSESFHQHIGVHVGSTHKLCLELCALPFCTIGLNGIAFISFVFFTRSQVYLTKRTSNACTILGESITSGAITAHTYAHQYLHSTLTTIIWHLSPQKPLHHHTQTHLFHSTHNACFEPLHMARTHKERDWQLSSPRAPSTPPVRTNQEVFFKPTMCINHQNHQSILIVHIHLNQIDCEHSGSHEIKSEGEEDEEYARQFPWF